MRIDRGVEFRVAGLLLVTGLLFSCSGSTGRPVAPSDGSPMQPPAAATTGRATDPAPSVAGSHAPDTSVTPPVPIAGMPGPTTLAGTGGVPAVQGSAGAGGIEGSVDWISYGNGPRNWFNNTAETKLSVQTAAGLHVAWMETPGEVTAPPLVVGDRLYVTSNAGLTLRNASDGEQIGMAPIRATSGAAYDEASAMVFVLDQGGRLHGLSVELDERWVMPVTMQAGARGWGSPVVVGDAVVVGLGAIDTGGFKGGVAAFDKLTGKPLWSETNTKTAGASVWSGPAGDLNEGVVYATTGNNYGATDDSSDSILARQLSDGVLLWNKQAEINDGFMLSGGGGPDHDFGTNPILLELKARKLIAAGQKSGVFWLLDRVTGQPVWTHKLCTTTTPQTGGIINNGAFDGTRFIVAANDGLTPGSVHALDPDPDNVTDSDPKRVVWSRKLDGLVWAPITVANGVCFVPAGRQLWVLDCATGASLHDPFPAPQVIGGAAAISNGRVFFGSGFTYPYGGEPGRTLIALSVD